MFTKLLHGFTGDTKVAKSDDQYYILWDSFMQLQYLCTRFFSQIITYMVEVDIYYHLW